MALHRPQGGPDHRVGVGAVPAERARLGRGEPGTQRSDEQQVERPVQDGLLAWAVESDLLGGPRDEALGDGGGWLEQ